MNKEQQEKLINLASDFYRIKDRSIKNLEIVPIRDAVHLNGIFEFSPRFKARKTEIKFRLLFTPEMKNPRRNVKVIFPVNHKTRHLIYRHDLRDHIRSLFNEFIY